MEEMSWVVKNVQNCEIDEGGQLGRNLTAKARRLAEQFGWGRSMWKYFINQTQYEHCLYHIERMGR